MMKRFAIVGLGYVGLGLATALAKTNFTIGYDIDTSRIQELQQHKDRNNLVDSDTLKNSPVTYTDNLEDIKAANFYIITVGTPVYYYEMPNLEPLIAATKDIATVLKSGDIVVYESTVYPRTTEDVCIPLLEEYSKLKHGKDFHVGYSPERVNPGDTEHTLANTTKIIAAHDAETLKEVQKAYQSICDETYPVSSIAIAEAIKILENTQRDVNIAFMNEFSKVMHALHLNMHEILEGAKTKWSFVPFKPGLVGGHCISVDPWYLVFQAKRYGIQTDLVSTARKVNDGITKFILQSLVKLLITNQIDINNITVGLFGISYKANTLDSRNSLSLKLAKEIREYGFECLIHDPLDFQQQKHPAHTSLSPFEAMKDLSAAIILVGHDYYRDLGIQPFINKCKTPNIIMDIPNLFVKEKLVSQNIAYWSL